MYIHPPQQALAQALALLRALLCALFLSFEDGPVYALTALCRRHAALDVQMVFLYGRPLWPACRAKGPVPPEVSCAGSHSLSYTPSQARKQGRQAKHAHALLITILLHDGTRWWGD